METLSNSNPKARKEHQCNYCDGKIAIGEVYRKATFVYEGSIYDWKNHQECQDIAEKLKMFDHCDEGLTQENFMDNISEYFYDNLADNRNKTKTFIEKLNAVKRYVFQITNPAQ